jgi:hypothetical protein
MDLGMLNFGDGSILGWSQFSQLPQLPHKMELASIVVKSD